MVQSDAQREKCESLTVAKQASYLKAARKLHNRWALKKFLLTDTKRAGIS